MFGWWSHIWLLVRQRVKDKCTGQNFVGIKTGIFRTNDKYFEMQIKYI